MKRFLFLISFIFCLFSYYNSNASHAAGGELVYELVPGTTNTYKFTFKFYRDCSGTSEPSSFTLCYNNNCGVMSQSITLSKVIGNLPNGQPNGSPVTTGCPSYPTNCNGGTIPGYREWWYTGNVTLNTQCNYWRFWVYLCCRNTGINNLNNSATQNIFIECNFDNTITQSNSSPFFSNPPIAYFCVNQQANINYGSIDPDGDSLVYESVEPRTGGGCATFAPTQIFSPGYNIIQPFPTGNTFNLNTNTGAITFIPTITGKWVFSVKVKEYRNGQYIGFIQRDIQIYVENCNTPSPIMNIDSLNIIGGLLNNGIIQGCAGDTLNFCVDLKSTSPIAILVPSDNSSLSLPGSIINYTNLLSDSIRACVNWTTSILDTGLHVLTITVKDSSCTPPGILVTNTFSIPININPITQAFGDTTLCTGGMAQLSVLGGSSFTWSVLPGGSGIGSLSCINCNNPIASPSITTSYVVTSNLSSVCNKSIDTVVVNVANTPTLTITPDTTTCVNGTLNLSVLASPANQNYTYSWSPSINLNNPNIPNPTVSNLNTNTTFTVTVVPQNLLACQSIATTNVETLLGFDILNNDTTICDGQFVQIISTGGSPKYNYSWSPSTNVSNPSILNPTISPSPSGIYNYIISASFPGCPDTSQNIKITVEAIPQVDIEKDPYLVCLGDTIHINTTISPNGNYTYQWSPVSDLNNSTIPNPIFDGKSSTNLTLTVSSPNGCIGQDNTQIDVIPADFLQIQKDTEICPGDSVNLVVSGGVSYLWIPSYLVTDSNSNSVIVKPISTTTFFVIGYDNKGCRDTVKATVVVNPEAVLNLGSDKTIYPGESVQLIANGNCSFFTWFPPNGLDNVNIKNPMANPSVTTRYYVKSTTEDGCSSYDSINVIVIPESLIEIPNVFSPGSGTSINDELRIIVKGYATLNSFRIFNRWGQEVFYTKNINEGWNGKYNGVPQPIGSYVYMVDVTTSSGRRLYKQGNITLIR